jgi:hypothetical protein
LRFFFVQGKRSRFSAGMALSEEVIEETINGVEGEVERGDLDRVEMGIGIAVLR